VIVIVVVGNDQGQYALWPAALDLPPGWHRRSPAMTRDEALAVVEARWPELTPVTSEAETTGGPLVPELFAGQAARRPRATAVAAGRARVSYRELAESSSRLAHYLRQAGAGPETVVGVHLERGADLIRSVLAVLKAGAACLPLDPGLPARRLARVCAQAGPALVLTAGPESAAPLSGAGPRLLPLSEIEAAVAAQPATGPAIRLDPGSLCYVICTSGTTGEPKAVAVQHGSLARVVGDLTRRYQVRPGDRVAQLAAMAFDTFLEQVLTTLAGGATLVLPPPGAVAPAELLSTIERERVSVIDLAPAYWQRLLALASPADERLRSVRLMITGGELADPAVCGAALRAVPGARLLNAYGLTETTITSALFDVGPWLSEVEPSEGGKPPVPVGRPVGGARIMVLDEHLRPVPAGTTGEVYVGGAVVARGYRGRPGLTAERFRPDPGGAPGSRMYRTGDTGCLLDDGSLVVTGRTDRQLQVAGFRVEPEEIESVLAGHPDIARVSVTASPQPGGTRLTASYRPAAGSAPTPASLRRYLADRLPGYMIPAEFVAESPVSAPAPVPATATGPTAPDTPVQAGLAALWARLLKRDQVLLDDDFFALGGNSLLAAEMLAHARALLGIPADAVAPLTRRLLRDPTLRGFAAAAQEATKGTLGTERELAGPDFAAEARLPVTIRREAAVPAPDWRRPREILLTGATGFLGAHLLHELVTATGARVHCLVRAPDEAAARNRLRQAAARYGLPAPPDGRVAPLPGDLAAPRLGLAGPAFRALARTVDVVYHVGAQVNFIYPYQELRAANVTGTAEVIRLAGDCRGIPVHYVSSTAVLAGLGAAGGRVATEETVLAHPELLRMGYVETKYVAEEMIRAAGRAGLPAAVYRPLDIVGGQRAGIWHTGTEMCALIRFIVDTGLAPDIDLPLDFVPVDVCAAAIREISARPGTPGRTYHLASPRGARLADLVGRLRAYGYPVSAVPYTDWVRLLAARAARDPAHPMAPFLPLFVNTDGSGRTVAELYLGDVFPRYSRDNTAAALQGRGIDFPPVSRALLDRGIKALVRAGYLPAPSPGPRVAHAS
jgi:amino acid adenylation domain-containing protein/thioester reductase-like protein